MGSSMNFSTQSLDFPLMAANNIAGKRGRETYTHKDTKSIKLK
jgi:hypothetical protein